MGVALKSGEAIPFLLLTESRDTTKFVRATVRDPSGSEVAGSPVSVPHLANGTYASNALLNMPNVLNIVVEYDVFDDALFTTPSCDLGPDEERFDLDNLTSELQTLETFRPSDVIAVVQDEDILRASVQDEDGLAAIAEDEEIESVIEDQTELGVKVDDSEIEGTVEE